MKARSERLTLPEVIGVATALTAVPEKKKKKEDEEVKAKETPKEPAKEVEGVEAQRNRLYELLKEAQGVFNGRPKTPEPVNPKAKPTPQQPKPNTKAPEREVGAGEFASLTDATRAASDARYEFVSATLHRTDVEKENAELAQALRMNGCVCREADGGNCELISLETDKLVSSVRRSGQSCGGDCERWRRDGKALVGCATPDFLALKRAQMAEEAVEYEEAVAAEKKAYDKLVLAVGNLNSAGKAANQKLLELGSNEQGFVALGAPKQPEQKKLFSVSGAALGAAVPRPQPVPAGKSGKIFR